MPALSRSPRTTRSVRGRLRTHSTALAEEDIAVHLTEPTPPPPTALLAGALHKGTATVLYSATLAAAAQVYADTCPTGHGTPASRDNAGENLFWAASSGSSPAVNFTHAVDSWYAEITDYRWPTSASGTVNYGGVTGHFTQVVWKDTRQVGCGGSTGCNNKFGAGWINNVIVCRYDPPGNWVGKYHFKVGSLA